MFFAMGMTEGKPRGGGSARSGGWRKLLAGCLLGSALVAGPALAAPLPLEGRQVDMTAREQPIASFLQDFFGTLDVPVSVSASAKGAVNGVFRGPADRVLGNVLRSFGLMAYYDGSVVHIYTPGEVTTRTFAMPGATAPPVPTPPVLDTTRPNATQAVPTVGQVMPLAPFEVSRDTPKIAILLGWNIFS